MFPQDQTTAVPSSWKPKDSVQVVHDALRSARSTPLHSDPRGPLRSRAFEVLGFREVE